MKTIVSSALIAGVTLTVAGAASAQLQPTRVQNAVTQNIDGSTIIPGGTEDPTGSYTTFAGVGNGVNGFFGLGSGVTDNTVVFDGISETIDTYISLAGGITPSVTESFTVNANGTQSIAITMSASGDLAPGGLSVGGPALDQLGFFIGTPAGGGLPVQSTQPFGLVTAANIDLLANGASLNGNGSIGFLVGTIWDGNLGIVFGAGSAGLGVNEIRFTITVGKVAVPTPGALALFGLAGLAGVRRRR